MKFHTKRQSTCNIRLADGSEIHIAQQIEYLGLALPREAWPAVVGVR